jgi:hypothetical protein
MSDRQVLEAAKTKVEKDLGLAGNVETHTQVDDIDDDS